MRRRRSVGTSYCKELVSDFEELARDLALPPKYEKHGRAMTVKIFTQLQRNAGSYKIKIDRVRLGGSNGKGTAISYQDPDGKERNSDFDLVLFVNDEEPPFDNVLKAFEAILRGMNFSFIKRTRISVQCVYDSPDAGPIKFDVLPAENHVKQRELGPNEEVGHRQARLAYEKVKRILNGVIDPDEMRRHSASFCEKTVDVIEDYVDNEFNLLVVRLAKYWNSHINIRGTYVSGRSAIVELIAIHCQRGRRKRCIVSGFRRFLEAMANLTRLQVVLGERPNFYDPCIDKVLSTDGPIIIDPVLKYNNMAYGMSKTVIAIFETQAKKTLELLEELRDLDGYQSLENPIEKIFSQK